MQLYGRAYGTLMPGIIFGLPLLPGFFTWNRRVCPVVVGVDGFPPWLVSIECPKPEPPTCVVQGLRGCEEAKVDLSEVSSRVAL